MRFIALCSVFVLMCASCTKSTNPIDPFECYNRKMFLFNMTVDYFLLKPPARLYRDFVPLPIRVAVNNAFDNLDMVPTIANDILQARPIWAIKDSWRFAINSTLGIGGLIDVAQKFGLPIHFNDLGLTFARWGNKKSPYLVLPIVGPSTVRDGTGWFFQFVLWSPYAYLNNSAIAWSLVGLRMIDLRSEFFDLERLVNESLDPYAFIRDAYLQRRNFLILTLENGNTGLRPEVTTTPSGTTSELGSDYVDE